MMIIFKENLNMTVFRFWLMKLLSNYIYIYIGQLDYTGRWVYSRLIWKTDLSSAD